MKSLFRYALFCLVCCYLGSASANEEILSFHSQLRVDEEARLWVVETIRVRAEGEQIRRGIFRDFPTRYRDHLGNHYQVGFELLEAQRDGHAENYRLETRRNGVRIYLGQSDQFLSPGEYEYRLKYRTERQLGFFPAYDELYWNVTGNGWSLPIRSVSGELDLPGRQYAADELQLALYTGVQGSTERAGTLSYQGQNHFIFHSKRSLAPSEGMTIAVGFPSGAVRRPSAMERFLALLHDNRALLWALFASGLLSAYFLRAWWRVGRDPHKGSIIPQYEPPQQLSAAACAYVLKMSMGFVGLTAALISCAVKGHLEIVQTGKRKYTLRRPAQPKTTRQSAELSPGEHQVLAKLIHPGEELVLEQREHRRLQSAYKALEECLEREYHTKLFHKNTRYWVRGLLLGLGAFIIQLFLQPSGLQIAFLALLTLGLLISFYFLLRAPTLSGRRVMDRIEGFRMYLATAEADRLQAMRGPELTPEVFEQFLPYAFALGVENTWCQRFETYLQSHREQQEHYQPHWYHGGTWGTQGLGQLGENLGGSFSSAISAAASPPGSQSGSGGGGSSGGGGGGGGGGGW